MGRATSDCQVSKLLYLNESTILLSAVICTRPKRNKSKGLAEHAGFPACSYTGLGERISFVG